MTRSRTVRLPVELDARIVARAERSNRTVSNQIVSLLIHAMTELEPKPKTADEILAAPLPKIAPRR